MQADKTERSVHYPSTFVEVLIVLGVKDKFIQEVTLNIVFEACSLLQDSTAAKNLEYGSEIVVVRRYLVNERELNERGMSAELEVSPESLERLSHCAAHRLGHRESLFDFVESFINPRLGIVKAVRLRLYDEEERVAAF